MSEISADLIKEQCIKLLSCKFDYPKKSINDISVDIASKHISISIHDDRSNIFFNHSSNQENKISKLIADQTGFKVVVTI